MILVRLCQNHAFGLHPTPIQMKSYYITALLHHSGKGQILPGFDTQAPARAHRAALQCCRSLRCWGDAPDDSEDSDANVFTAPTGQP